MYQPPNDQPARERRPQFTLFTLCALTVAVAVLLAVLRLDWLPRGAKIVFCLYAIMALVTAVLLTRVVLEWNAAGRSRRE